MTYSFWPGPSSDGDASRVRELQAELNRLELELKTSRQEVARQSAEIQALQQKLKQQLETIERPSPGKPTQGPPGAESQNRAAQSASETKRSQIAAVQARVEQGLLRRDEATLTGIFQKHIRVAETQSGKRAGLLAALREFNPSLEADDLHELERMISVKPSAEVTYEHFKQLVNQPSKVDQWVHSLPTSSLLADAVAALTPKSQDLRAVGELTVDEISSVCEGLIKGLEKMLAEHVKLLQESYKAMDAKAKKAETAAASKFQVSKMSCGTVDDYHGGIEGRTGPPCTLLSRHAAHNYC